MKRPVSETLMDDEYSQATQRRKPESGLEVENSYGNSQTAAAQTGGYIETLNYLPEGQQTEAYERLVYQAQAKEQARIDKLNDKQLGTKEQINAEKLSTLNS